MIRPNPLVEIFRTELRQLAIPANVRGDHTGAVRIDIGAKRFKARQYFTMSEQEDIRTVAAQKGLHWVAPECGAWPVRVDERPHNPETFTFYGE